MASVPEPAAARARGVRALRLFLALWPDAATRAALHAYQRTVDLRGRAIPAANLHLTLAFIGAAPPEAAAPLMRALREARPEAVELRFDRLGYFQTGGTLWAGCAEAPPALLDFRRRLGIGLAGAGFTPEKRSFRPHVTLMRDCARAGLERVPRPAVEWTAREFALMQSVSGPRGVAYRMIESVSV